MDVAGSISVAEELFGDADSQVTFSAFGDKAQESVFHILSGVFLSILKFEKH
jgi:hypothetical protein